jgi:hypothetical protein
MPIKVRMAHPVGWVAHAGAWWPGPCGDQDEHHARWETARGDGDIPDDASKAAYAAPIPADAACTRCGAPVPADASRSGGGSRTWDTPSGDLEPGCLFWGDWLPHQPSDDPGPMACPTWKNSDGTIRSRGWTNCTGRHLHCVLPNGIHWDIDARASNCTLPDDTLHRCWVRVGDPETGDVHVDKDGYSCAAGAGSIAAGDYHGFLHHGTLT